MAKSRRANPVSRFPTRSRKNTGEPQKARRSIWHPQDWVAASNIYAFILAAIVAAVPAVATIGAALCSAGPGTPAERKPWVIIIPVARNDARASSDLPAAVTDHERDGRVPTVACAALP